MGWPVMVSFEVEGFASEHGEPVPGAPLCGNGSSVLNGTEVSHGAFTAYAAWATPHEALSSYFDSNGTFDEHSLSRRPRPNYPVDVWDGVAGGMWMQRAKQLLIARGIAVISVNPWAVDSMDWDPVSWERGLDRPFYTELLRQLRGGVLGPLDPHRLIFRGYSAGAQQTSWFAQLYASGEASTEGTSMVGGVMVSGGTYACYGSSNASDGTDGTVALGSCAACDAYPHCRNSNCSATAAKPCCKYCCPTNYTEAWYEGHPEAYASHPAAFLAQLSTWDQNADLCAAKNYHETLISRGARSQLVLVRPEDEDCFCIGNPGSHDSSVAAEAAQSPYGGLCVNGSASGRFKCGQHAMAFAGMVNPMADWAVKLAYGNGTTNVKNNKYKVDFGPPRLVGGSNFTHFWFPITEVALGAGTFLQLVEQGPDGGSCPPKGHPDWPCSAAYATTDRGSAWRAVPKPFPSPLLPESRLNSKRVMTPTGSGHGQRANFSTFSLRCVDGGCSGALTSWSTSTTPRGEVPTFKQLLVQPLAVGGIPPDVRQAEDGLLPVMLQDGSILVAMYGYTQNATSSCSRERPSCYSLFFFSCPDPVSTPTQWVYTSRIDAVPAMVPAHAQGARPVEGPCEPALCQHPDGRVLVVFRVSSYQELWGAVSSDGGRQWGASFRTGTWSVSPNLVAMKSGAVVLSAGRPGIGLWVSSFDSMPPRWAFRNVLQEHNSQVTQAAHRFPDIDAAVGYLTSKTQPFPLL
jgi:hypothetical protein